MDEQVFTAAATELADATDCDVLFFNGEIERPYDDKLLALCASSNRRSHVLLILCTYGGDADAAYRMSRGLQRYYKRITVVLAGYCKSAGTLVTLGAHELVMTDQAELGPLDVQMGKKDEVFERASGLTILKALTEVEDKAFAMFEKAAMRIKVGSQGSVTFKTASSIASELARGIIAPIAAQIDPMHLGEVSRAMAIGKEYGRRLSDASKNLKERAVERLVDDYPSHNFVIDRQEAESLFLTVRQPSDKEGEVLQLMGRLAQEPRTEEGPILFFVSKMKKETEYAGVDHAADRVGGEAPMGAADGGLEALLPSKKPTGHGPLKKQETGT